MISDFNLNDTVEMKKEHPCKKSKYWKVIRMGADIKIKCLGCGAVVMFPRGIIYVINSRYRWLTKCR